MAADPTGSALRHALRNKLGSIRNAAFYLWRRLGKAGPDVCDDEMRAMLALLGEEVEAAVDLLDPPDKPKPYVPVTGTPAPRAQAPQAPARRTRLLLVDDDPGGRFILSSLLR